MKRVIISIAMLTVIQCDIVAANPFTWLRSRYHQWWADKYLENIKLAYQNLEEHKQEQPTEPFDIYGVLVHPKAYALLAYQAAIDDIAENIEQLYKLADLRPDQQTQVDYWNAALRAMQKDVEGIKNQIQQDTQQTGRG